MFKSLGKAPEWRILAYLGIITLSVHLLSIFGSLITTFSSIILIIILSWILAFIIEPAVLYLTSRGISRLIAAALVYTAITAAAIVLVWIVLPTAATQLAELATLLPSYLPATSPWSARLEEFLTSSLTNSVSLASQLAAILGNILLVFILSFYVLLSRKEISTFLLKVIPDDFEEDYLFLEHTFNTTFASFLRIQFILGLIMGALTYLVLLILGIDYALSTSVAAAILAMIPVIGPVVSLFPPALASLVVSPQQMVITLAVITLASQLVYNVLAPKLLGNALKIHPIIVLISFLVGYKLAGVWGAIFAVPVTSALAIVGRDLLKYWHEAADK